MANNSNIKAKDVIKGVFSSYAPVTSATISSIRETAKETKEVTRRIRKNAKEAEKTLNKSIPGKKAIALFMAAKQALQEGSYEINDANDAMYDDYEDYQNDFITDSMTEEEKANTSPEEVILRGNRGVAKSVIRASTAQLSGMNAISSRILKGTLSGMQATASSINSTILHGTNILAAQIGVTNTKLDTINANLASLIEYQNQNTTLFYEKNLELMNSMISGMNNLNTMSQGKGARDLKNFNVSNGFNIKDYLSRVKNGIKNSAMFSGVGMLGSMHSMAMQNPEIMSMGEMYGQMLPGILGMIPQLNKVTGKMNMFSKLDKRFGQYLNEALYRIGDKLSGNMIASLLGLDSLGNKRRTISGINLSNYMKEQLPWNGKAQKALTEVIPELLTSIDAGINNTDKRYFDFDEGNWRSRKEIEQNFDSQVKNSITLEFNNLLGKLNNKLQYNGLSKESIDSIEGKISDTINDLIYGEGDLKSTRQTLADTLKEANLSMSEFASAFNNIQTAISNSTDLISDFYAKVGSSDSIYRNINNRSGKNSRETIGESAYQSLRKNRKNNNLFGMSYSEDIKSIMQYVEYRMKEEYKDFKITPDIQDGILAAARSGASSYDIYDMVKKSYARSEMSNVLKDALNKVKSKITKKPYVKESSTAEFEDEDAEDFGRFGNDLNLALLESVYGIKSGYKTTTETIGKHVIKNYKDKRAYNRNLKESVAQAVEGSNDPESELWKKWAIAKGKSDFNTDQYNADVDFYNSLGLKVPWLQKKKDYEDISISPSKKVKVKKSVGAASSRATTDAGKVAGAGTNASTQTGKSSSIQVDDNIESTKVELVNNATKSFSDTINSNATDLSKSESIQNKGADAIIELGKSESETTDEAIKKLADTSVISMGTMLSSFNSFGSKLFGKEGLITKIANNEEVKKGINNIKEKLFNEKTGIFKDQVAGFKKWKSENWKKTKEELGKKYDSAFDLYSKYRYTTDEYQDYHDNPAWQNNKIIQFFKRKPKNEVDKPTEYDNIENSNKTSILEVSNPESQESTANNVKTSIEEVASEAPVVLKNSINQIAEAGTEAATELKSSTEAVTSAIVADPNKKPEDIKKEYSKSFMNGIKKYLPKIGAGAIVGAGVGMLNGFGGHSLLGSLFLPTGLIGGAIVGGGLSILSQTEAFKSLMFGKLNEKTGKREGGLISKDLKSKFSKSLPIIVGGAIAGGLKSLITGNITNAGLGILGTQLLPGGILGGAIIGTGVGLLKNSELFNSLVFGKKDKNTGKRTGTFLSKSFESMKKNIGKIAPSLKNMAKGAGLGAVTGATMLHMGALPAALSMGGPIGMGIMGLGAGLAASTKNFNTWLFGTEELDDNGNPIGRHGGILERVRNILKVNVIEPITYSFRKNMIQLVDWTKDKVTLPFRTAFGPIIDSISEIKDNIVDFVKDKFTTIGEGIKSIFSKTLKAIFSPITKLIGVAGSALMGGAKLGLQVAAAPITMGLQGLNLLTLGKRRKAYQQYRSDYLSQDGKGMNNVLQEMWDAKNKDGKHVGFFEKLSDTISAYRGYGPIADAYNEEYYNRLSEDGKNKFNWMGARIERKKLRKKKSADKKMFKKWDKIYKFNQKVGKEYGGREFNLSDAQVDWYREKYAKMGIDKSHIKNSQDVMDLIYRTDKFKRKIAGDSGVLGEYAALSPEEKLHMNKTEEIGENQLKVLMEIRDAAKTAADEAAFNDRYLTYDEKRTKDKRILKKRFNKLYKSSAWARTGKVDLDDPDLWEYDISKIDDDILKDYASSNYADANDFKGYLDSIGRKYNTNDSRRDYHTAEYRDGLWKKAKGKSSQMEPDPQATELVNAVKEQNDIAKATLAMNTNGESNADDIISKTKNGTLDSKTASKFSFTGMITNFFNKKAKSEKKAARDKREAEESAEAQSLGDKSSEENVKEEDNSDNSNAKLSDKVLAAISGGISWFGNTKVGRMVNSAGKLLGTVGVLGGIGLTIAEIIKPGTAEDIGAAISDWNDKTKKSANDGTLLDNIKNKIGNWFNAIDVFVNEKVLGPNGMIVQTADAISSAFPVLINKIVLPGIQTTANFIADNAETLVSAAGTVITAIAPPLAEAVAKVIPTVIVSLGKGFFDNIFGTRPEKAGQQNLTQAQRENITNSGGAYIDNWESVSADDAKIAKNAGMEVRQNNDGSWEVNNAYTLDSNTYIGDDGKQHTRLNQSGIGALTTLGSRLLINGATGRGAANKLILKSIGKNTLKFGAGMIGGSIGMLGGTPGMLAGFTTGTKIGNKASNKIGKWLSKFGSKAVTDYSDDAVELLMNATGKAATNMSEEIVKTGVKESTGFLGKIIKMIKGIPDAKWLKTLVNRFAGSHAEAFLKAIRKFISETLIKLSEASAQIASKTPIGKKIMRLISEKTAALGAKTAAAGMTVFISELAFISIGAIAGAAHPENLFEVSSSQVDWKMRVISALLNGFLSSTAGTAIDIALLIIQLLTGFDGSKWFATTIYKHLSLDGSAVEDLEKAQDSLAIEAALYNKDHGTNLTASEYNDITNKGFLGKTLDKITGRSVDTSKYKDEVKQIMKSGSYTKDSNGNITLNDDNNAGYGTGKPSYGKGPNAQGDSKWANMPIGRFSNGQVSTMKSGGCGPTALSTIANILGKDTNPGTVGAYAATNGYITNGGANDQLFTKGAAGFGLVGKRVSDDNFDQAVNQSPMAISGVNNGPFTKNGHVVVANGTDKNGNVNIIDPMDGKSKKYSKSTIKAGMTNAWAYQTPIGYGKIVPKVNHIDSTTNTTKTTHTGPAWISNILTPEGMDKMGISKSKSDHSNIRTGKKSKDNSLTNIGLTSPATLSHKTGIRNETPEKKTYNKSIDDISDTTNDDTTDDSVDTEDTSVDYIQELQDTLSDAPTNVGGLIGGFKKFTSFLKAILGVIKGEGTFEECYNRILGNEISGDTVTSSGVVLSTDEEKEYIWKTLKDKGYSNEAAAAIMGNWQKESSNKARTIEANWIKEFPGYDVVPADRDALDKYTREGVFMKTKNVNKDAYYAPDGRYYPGIGYPQWTGGRSYSFLNWAAENNLNWDDPETQIAYFNKEMDTTYSKTKGRMKADTSVDSATKDFYNGFERGDQSADKKYSKDFAERLNYANQFYELYTTMPEEDERTDEEKYADIINHGQIILNNALNPKPKSNNPFAGDHSLDNLYGINTTNYIPSNIKKQIKSNNGKKGKFGRGPVGFGPDDGPTNFNEFMEGSNAVISALSNRMRDLGLGDFLGDSVSNDSVGISYDSSNWGETSSAPVNAMKSIYGKLHYSLDGDKQNPDKGTASCASTVAWAYNKALGIRPGDAVGPGAYMSSTAQSKDNRFSTIWTNNGSGLTSDVIRSLRPGDIIYQNWNRSSNNGEMKHTEMYVGNGKTISHGGPKYNDMGPVYKDLTSDYRRKHTMMIRRYNGFLNSNNGYGMGPDNKKDYMRLDNNYFKDDYYTKHHTTNKKLPHPEGDNNGYGPGNNIDISDTNIVNRLDKILEVIGEWYLDSKKNNNGKTSDKSTSDVVNKINNGKSAIRASESTPTIKSHMEKLIQKHQSYAKMYKN